jgi:energy-coupling factor transport system ATP-binding protein
MAIIDIHELTYSYPGAAGPALADIDLQVTEGQFVALIGANGAGKSTLGYLLSGFVPHFYKGTLTGRSQVAGLDTQAVGLNDLVLNVGLVFQNPFTQMSGAKFTVYEEIAFGLENLGLPRAEMRERIDQALALTNIGGLAKRSPYALSGGQQQRVALASILAMRPRVLVLDEPTSQLDPIGTREVFQVIKALSRQGVTIVMAEHKMEWIAEFADRVVALSGGRIIAQGAPRDVLTAPLLAEAGIGVARYTSAARRAAAEGLWPAGRPLPITLAEAEAGFAEGRHAR